MKTAFEIFQEHKSPKSKEGLRRSKLSGKELFDEAQERKGKKKSKMGNKPVVFDNIWFQSEGEGHFYLSLKEQLQRGKIKDFKRQIPFEFFVNGIRIGKYVCDFGVLYHDNTVEILDYKSRFTATLALFEMKEALMIACYQVEIKKVGMR